MLKTLAWLGGSTVATAAATFTHGPLLTVLVIFAAVVLAALVTTYVAALASRRRPVTQWRTMTQLAATESAASDGWYATATSHVSSRTNGRAANFPVAAATSRAGFAR